MSVVQFTFVLVLASFICVQAQKTSLDQYIKEYRAIRGSLFKLIGRSDTESAYLWNLRREKVQKPFAKSTKFFCDTKNGPGARSATIPETVHRLRPGDIDVVAAIGDSLTAGNGALATSILQVFIENKGVSWSIGGQGNWRKYLTVNILQCSVQRDTQCQTDSGLSLIFVLFSFFSFSMTAAEYSERIQSKIVRILIIGWILNRQNFKVSSMLWMPQFHIYRTWFKWTQMNKLNAHMPASGCVHSFNSNTGDNTGDSLHYIE